MKEIEEKTGKNLSNIPIIIADVFNKQSLIEMAKRTRVIVNCVGPFRFYGEFVVKACLYSQTHHIDISAENQYTEKMQLEYHDIAKERGIYVLSTCGFDSIVTEMGISILEDNFGCLNSVESYLYLKSIKKIPYFSPLLHYTTWESAMYCLNFKEELKKIRSRLFADEMPMLKPKLESRGLIHVSKIVDNLICLPLYGCDEAVVARSQRYFYKQDKKRPVQMKEYLVFDSLIYLMCFLYIGAIYWVLSKFSFGRELLKKYPRFFSLGGISHDGPSEETMKNSGFEVVLHGQGWKNKLSDSGLENPLNKRVIIKVSGTDPGYGTTCICALNAAKIVLKENSKMPESGGVYTPAVAFKNTSLIEKLKKDGIYFEIINTSFD